MEGLETGRISEVSGIGMGSQGQLGIGAILASKIRCETPEASCRSSIS